MFPLVYLVQASHYPLQQAALRGGGLVLVRPEPVYFVQGNRGSALLVALVAFEVVQGAWALAGLLVD